jgi:integrase
LIWSARADGLAQYRSKPRSKAILDRWAEAAGFSTGTVFRAINKGGRLDPESKLSPQAVFLTVVGYAEQAGLPVRPRDLRRTFVKLTFKAGAPLEQIQISLGHASIQTTERYLGVRQDLGDTTCDRLKRLFNACFEYLGRCILAPRETDEI